MVVVILLGLWVLVWNLTGHELMHLYCRVFHVPVGKQHCCPSAWCAA